MSNFNYYPLVWMLTSARSFRKTEAIQKGELRFMLNNYKITYKDLLNQSRNPNMNLGRTRSLGIRSRYGGYIFFLLFITAPRFGVVILSNRSLSFLILLLLKFLFFLSETFQMVSNCL